MTVSRRDVLKLAASAAAAPLLPRPVAALANAAAGLPAGRFFSAPELALLDELTELIIPADEHSGGARAAAVAGYIDSRLFEYDPELPERRAARERFKAGLAAIDAASREGSGQGFLSASPEERLRVLQALAAAEPSPQTEAERFFKELKEWTADGYYTSRIGIHDEMEYKGNSMLAEFAGTDPASLPPRGEPR